MEAVDLQRREELLERYNSLRHVGRKMHLRMAELLDREEIHEAADRLGMLRGETIVLDTEDMISVVMDFALLHLRRDGQNAVQRLLAGRPAPARVGRARVSGSEGLRALSHPASGRAAPRFWPDGPRHAARRGGAADGRCFQPLWQTRVHLRGTFPRLAQLLDVHGRVSAPDARNRRRAHQKAAAALRQVAPRLPHAFARPRNPTGDLDYPPRLGGRHGRTHCLRLRPAASG